MGKHAARGMARLSLTACLALAGIAQAAPRYAMTDLGALIDGSPSFATRINNAGDIVGFTVGDADGNFTGFLYRAGKMTDIHMIASGISDTGYISGSAAVVTNDGINFRSRAFVQYPDGSGTRLPILAPQDNADVSAGAADVNDAGQVVGSSNTDPLTTHAFLYNSSDGTIHDLGTLGGDSSEAHAINDRGQIVGGATDASDTVYGFLYQGGLMTNIGRIGPDDINNNGVIAGIGFDAPIHYHAIIDDHGAITDLGLLTGTTQSEAFAINLSGQAVGTSSLDFNGTGDRAFLYTDGQLFDLNTLIDPTSGWYLAEATDINDAGQIVGTGTNPDGITRAFLLTPLPEPSSLALLLPASILVRRNRRR